jgi:peptidoglycan/xylan/chitin deacetylase (PgdA/CDA1 family)
MGSAVVLTYHSGNIEGNDYATNNLVALAQDLATIHRLKLPLVPLLTVAQAVVSRDFASLPDRVVAISLDDGLDFDFRSLVHPFHGMQPSVHQILDAFSAQKGATVHATSFVIASPDARAQIANREMLGYQWMSDSWWQSAVASGFFHIGNHTWDHMSPSVEANGEDSSRRASSRFIGNLNEANRQIRQARRYIESIAPNPGSSLLAYPYGDYSSYLIEQYLPEEQSSHGTIAAFTTTPGVITESSNRWTLPRYMCGDHWKSPDMLSALLRA